MKKIYKSYCWIEIGIVSIGFFSIILMTFANAVLRFFDYPIVQSDDICMLLFAWVSFMGADIALRQNRLVKMDLVTMKLSKTIQKILQLIVYMIMIAVLFILIKYGFSLAKVNWARICNTLPISYGWITLSIPICSIQMVLTIIIKISEVVKSLIEKKDDTNVCAKIQGVNA